MRDKIKLACRLVLQGAIWVYVLSIQVGGQTLFHRAHEVLVNNQVVAAIESQITRGYQSAIDMAASGAGRVFARRDRG